MDDQKDKSLVGAGKEHHGVQSVGTKPSPEVSAADAELLALLDDVDAAHKKATDGPYYVGGDIAEDCPDHRHSGLALIDTGRGGDWPVARLCEWPTAEFVAAVCNAWPVVSRELRAQLNTRTQLTIGTRKGNRDYVRRLERFMSSNPITSEVQKDLYEALNMVLPLAESYLRKAPGDPDNAKLETARAAIALHQNHIAESEKPST